MDWDSGSSTSALEAPPLSPAGSLEYWPEQCSRPLSFPPQIQKDLLFVKWYEGLSLVQNLITLKVMLAAL